MEVLFTSNRPLGRAENISAVFDAYDGEKRFVQVNPLRRNPDLVSRKYAVRVTDEFPAMSPGQCIYIGHGVSGGKLVGLDQPYPYYIRENARLITYALATSVETIDLVAKQCGIPKERVVPLGLPRTDQYFGKVKGDGGTILAGKRAYLFCPTYRTKEELPYQEIDWYAIDRALTDGEILAVKPHMLQKQMLVRKWRHIVELSSTEPTAPYLIDCDVLITDYSSIMLDAHILRKPVVLFSKEDSYLTKRGMYFEYPGGYASRFCTGESELVKCMREANSQGPEDLKCLKVTAGACDGHSTERLVKLIKEML